ncbi:MAG TPA: hypothetical protein VLG40_00455, partial [Candidatus Saccharimonas sp.]|nr:hypothetical protein [Candidatus Saccharimonas sp.]
MAIRLVEYAIGLQDLDFAVANTDVSFIEQLNLCVAVHAELQDPLSFLLSDEDTKSSKLVAENLLQWLVKNTRLDVNRVPGQEPLEDMFARFGGMLALWTYCIHRLANKMIVANYEVGLHEPHPIFTLMGTALPFITKSGEAISSDDWRMFVEAVLCRAATLRRVASAELILPRDVYNRANSLVVGHVETLV